MPTVITFLLVGAAVIALVTLVRLYTIIPFFSPKPPQRRSEQSSEPARLLIVLGSGGHTAEMLSLLSNGTLDTSKFTHRSYLVSSGDAFSMGKALSFEDSLLPKASLSSSASTDAKASKYGSYDIAVVPRARRIHQGLLTTPFSCAKCLISCLAVMRGLDSSTPSHLSVSASSRAAAKPSQKSRQYPDLILANGPATAVIAILAALLLRFLGFSGTKGKMRIIYVESWARVRRLSLSGKILVWLVDRFIVQWESLLPATYGRGEYLGVLIA